MLNKEYQDNNEYRKEKLRQDLLSDSQSQNSQGVSLVLTGEPRMKVHRKRQQIRDKMTHESYKMVRETPKKTFTIGSGVSLEIKPDPKYVSIHEWCEKERKTAIEEQIKSKQTYKEKSKIIEKQEQTEYLNHMSKIDSIAEKIEANRRTNEKEQVTKEVQRNNAKKSRDQALQQVEKERMRKINELIEERNNKFEENRRAHHQKEKNEIRQALEMQLNDKRQRKIEEKQKQKLIINT